LRSLGHPKSDRLALIMGEYITDLIKNFGDSEITYDVSEITRKYHKRLKEETRSFINQHPHFIRVHSFDPVKMDYSLCKWVVNKAWTDLVDPGKIYSPDLGGSCEGWRFMLGLTCYDWMQTWLR
jgi:hypothetical protein